MAAVRHSQSIEGRAPHHGGRRIVRRWWYLLLLAQFVGVLVVPFYARETPKAWGIPFFYWYQFLWVIIGALLTGAVYLLTTRRAGERHGRDGRRH
jgi:hypothetical protein